MFVRSFAKGQQEVWKRMEDDEGGILRLQHDDTDVITDMIAMGDEVQDLMLAVARCGTMKIWCFRTLRQIAKLEDLHGLVPTKFNFPMILIQFISGCSAHINRCF